MKRTIPGRPATYIPPMNVAPSGGNGLSSWEAAVTWLRSQPDQRELVLAAYYDDPLPDAAERYRRSAEWQAIREHLPPARGPALDVGAGRGIASYALARDGYAVTALEPDPSALVGAEAIRGLASAAGLPIEVVQDFSERLPFADHSFELVFARAVLHHTKDLTEACREFHRVLRPGGLLIAVREHVISAKEDLAAFFDVHPLHRLYGGENAFLLSEYLAALRVAGFTVEHTIAPLRSPMNLAPRTAQDVRRELSLRVTCGHGWAAGLVGKVLDQPGVWKTVLPFVEQLDHRPGRLYSFVARKSP